MKVFAGLLLAFAMLGCAHAQVQEADAWKRIGDGALLIDVRTEGEFRSGHLEGALNIPYEKVDALVAAIGSDKARPVALYCRSGRRSGIATTSLAARGYTNVVNIGSYTALKAAKP